MSTDPLVTASASDPIVIDRIPVRPDAAAIVRLTCERVFLTAQERRWPRRRVTTDSGRVLVLALTRGGALEPGTILHVGSDWYARLEAAPEPVIVVAPLTRDQRIRLAHEVGGQHSSIAVDGEDILIPDDPVMMRVVCRLDLPWRRALRPFLPISMGTPH
jgi:urease accessory protein UreE